MKKLLLILLVAFLVGCGPVSTVHHLPFAPEPRGKVKTKKQKPYTRKRCKGRVPNRKNYPYATAKRHLP